jgi:hypothetical protein
MLTGAEEFCNKPDDVIPADMELSICIDILSRLFNSSNALLAKKKKETNRRSLDKLEGQPLPLNNTHKLRLDRLNFSNCTSNKCVFFAPFRVDPTMGHYQLLKSEKKKKKM